MEKMKKLGIVICTLLFTLTASAQTWNEEVAEIVHANCASCHNPNGIGVSLLDYSDAFDYKSVIGAYVESGVMPPWTADTSFQHYYDERTLTTYERTTILDWVSAGAPEGAGTPPPPPVFQEQLLPGEPDLVIEIEPYMSKATPTSDDYVCISIPSGLTGDRKLKALEVIPGNRPIVHHCLVYHDGTGTYESDTIGGDCSGPDDAADLLGGYAPGAQPTVYPSDVAGGWQAGMEIKAGSNIILAMHYPHGSYGEWDSTKVHLYFYDEPVSGFREVWALPLVMDWDFTILAGTVDTVEASFGPTFTDYSGIGALPHMHLIGESIETYAIDPDDDTIPFVRIPKWDFEWQDLFFYEYLQKIPTGSVIEGRGVYNNTSSNPFNPHDPPIDVSAGFDTEDEMFLIYYMYMQYQAGDEYFNVDSANTVFLSDQLKEELLSFQNLKVFPNPFNDQVELAYSLQKDAQVDLYIYDTQGRLIRKLFRGNQAKGLQQLNWDGRNEAGEEVFSGMYFYSMTIDGQYFSGRLVKE